MSNRERRSNIAKELFHDGSTVTKLFLLSTLSVAVAFLTLVPFTTAPNPYMRHTAYFSLAVIYLAANALDAWILLIAYWRWQAHSLHREVGAAAVMASLQAACWHAIFRSHLPMLVTAALLGAVGICLSGLLTLHLFARRRKRRDSENEAAAP